jgi:hypothetical protein
MMEIKRPQTSQLLSHYNSKDWNSDDKPTTANCDLTQPKIIISGRKNMGPLRKKLFPF